MKYARKDAFTKPNTAIDILNLALEKEKSSRDFYADLLVNLDNPALKTVLKKLLDSENEHIQIIERMIDK